jgi:hypothetical protein
VDSNNNDDDGERDRTNLLVLGIAAVIVIAGGIVMYFVKQNLDLQRCEFERRMDCHAIPLDDDGG